MQNPAAAAAADQMKSHDVSASGGNAITATTTTTTTTTSSTNVRGNVGHRTMASLPPLENLNLARDDGGFGHSSLHPLHSTTTTAVTAAVAAASGDTDNGAGGITDSRSYGDGAMPPVSPSTPFLNAALNSSKQGVEVDAFAGSLLSPGPADTSEWREGLFNSKQLWSQRSPLLSPSAADATAAAAGAATASAAAAAAAANSNLNSSRGGDTVWNQVVANRAPPTPRTPTSTTLAQGRGDGGGGGVGGDGGVFTYPTVAPATIHTGAYNAPLSLDPYHNIPPASSVPRHLGGGVNAAVTIAASPPSFAVSRLTTTTTIDNGSGSGSGGVTNPASSAGIFTPGAMVHASSPKPSPIGSPRVSPLMARRGMAERSGSVPTTNAAIVAAASAAAAAAVANGSSTADIADIAAAAAAAALSAADTGSDNDMAMRQLPAALRRAYGSRQRYLFIDNGNIFVGAQSTSDGNMDLAVRVNVKELSELLEESYTCAVREVAASRPSNPRICSTWQKVGYMVHIDGGGRGGGEGGGRGPSARQILAMRVSSTVTDTSLAGTPQTLVLATGDGSQFPQLAELALRHDWHVIVWSWNRCLSDKFRKLRLEFPDLLELRLLDKYRDRITFRAAERSASAGATNAAAAAAAAAAALLGAGSGSAAPRSASFNAVRRR